MSNTEEAEIRSLKSQRRHALGQLRKHYGRFVEASAALAARDGDFDIAEGYKIQKASNKKAVAGPKKTVGKKVNKKGPAIKIKKPVPKKATQSSEDFECKASEITGEPCKAVTGQAVKAAATVCNKRKYPTCKACKKAAVAKVKSTGKKEEPAEQPVSEALDASENSASEPMEVDEQEEEEGVDSE